MEERKLSLQHCTSRQLIPTQEQPRLIVEYFVVHVLIINYKFSF